MPGLFSVYDKYRDKGLVVIGVHVDTGREIDSATKLDEKVAAVRNRLWKGRDIPFPVALVLSHPVPYRPDVKAEARCPLVAEYGIVEYPTGVLINRNGRVVGAFEAGYADKTLDPFERSMLEKTINEK